MSATVLDAMRDLIQEDVGGRGLRTDPRDNLITACPGDFAAACHSIAATAEASLVVVTGFFIAHATPPCGETDGPLGALFLARALTPLGIRVTLATDPFCARALEVGVAACGLAETVAVEWLPPDARWLNSLRRATHLVALERVGPSHTPESLREQPHATAEHVARFVREVPPDHYDRCHNMRGVDITAMMRPAHRLFERRYPTTIGIGDGGNELGMGKVGWDVIRRNIADGGRIACRVATEHLIVAGVSNWGAYALAAGVRLLRRAPHDPGLFDVARERELLAAMVEQGPLVDGKSGQPAVMVDGLAFERYAEVLSKLGELLAGE